MGNATQRGAGAEDGHHLPITLKRIAWRKLASDELTEPIASSPVPIVT